MAKSVGYRNRIELLQGTLDMLILQTLFRGTQHGYGISQAIHSRSGEVLKSRPDRSIGALHIRWRRGGTIDGHGQPSED